MKYNKFNPQGKDNSICRINSKEEVTEVKRIADFCHTWMGREVKIKMISKGADHLTLNFVKGKLNTVFMDK